MHETRQPHDDVNGVADYLAARPELVLTLLALCEKYGERERPVEENAVLATSLPEMESEPL